MSDLLATDRSSAPELDSTRGWQVVASTFLATFTVFGVAYSFGAFFRPMADEFGSERGETALFFAITTFLYFMLGVVTGRIADRIGPRRVMQFGAAVMSIGLLITSRVDSLWVGYLTYGLGVGIGVACAYVPMVAAVGGWFERRRTTALGIAVAGIGTGTLVVAPLAEHLVDARGWRNTYVIFGIASGCLLALASLGAHRPPNPTGGVEEPEPLAASIGRSREFWTLYLSVTLMTLALFVPFVFMADYMDERNISGSPGIVVGLIGLSSVVGRLGLGALGSRIPVMQLYIGSFAVLGLSFLIWLAAGDSYALLVVFAIVLGTSYGGFIALSPAVAAQIFGVVGLGGILGALYTGAGVGGLLGPPLMGRLIDSAGYDTTLIASMCCGLAATFVLTRVEGTRSR